MAGRGLGSGVSFYLDCSWLRVSGVLFVREIKFRAWDGEVMLYNTQEYPLHIINGGFPTFMQYTGLTDSSGTEIYEGDILELPNYGKYRVVWDTDTASFYTILLDSVALEQYMYVNIFEEGWVKSTSVLGDIYEDIDLL